MANNTGCELTGFPKARVGMYGRAISPRPSKLKLSQQLVVPDLRAALLSLTQAVQAVNQFRVTGVGN